MAVAVFVASLVGCARNDDFRPQQQPGTRLKSLNIDGVGCEHFDLVSNFKGSGRKSKRGTDWWNLKVWKNEEGCEVSAAVFVYAGSDEAADNYSIYSPEQVDGSSWPWPPAQVEVPNDVKSDQAKLLCLGGSPKGGCLNWYYWARYGNVLVEAQVYNFGTRIAGKPGVKMTKRQFMRFVRDVDRVLNKR